MVKPDLVIPCKTIYYLSYSRLISFCLNSFSFFIVEKKKKRGIISSCLIFFIVEVSEVKMMLMVNEGDVYYLGVEADRSMTRQDGSIWKYNRYNFSGQEGVPFSLYADDGHMADNIGRLKPVRIEVDLYGRNRLKLMRVEEVKGK